MTPSTPTLRWRLLVCSVGLFVIALFSACGSDDPCANTTCDFGVCESSSGQCVNESTCYVDDQCIPGYVCGDGNSCEAEATCESDGDCSAGVCNDDGVCVNDSGGCESNDECVARTFCAENGRCRPDPCNDVSCQRGVCQRGTDKCVSADTCTENTELLDCVQGEKCAEGVCAPMETFCDGITCERGVCSFEAGGCADAANCEGDDQNCLEGAYCNDMDQCRPDLCAQNDVQCDRGVCIASTGECQNATACEANGDCLSNHVCVEGTCRLQSVACGDAGGDGGCPGNQTCEYNAANLSASCQEPEVCASSFDCTGDRLCGGQSCLDPVDCRADAFEPNESAGESVNIIEVAPGGLLEASLCSNDVDWFSFDSTDLTSPTSSAQLLVRVDVAGRDRGLGQVDVEVQRDGTTVAMGSSGAMGREARIDVPLTVGIAEHGVYDVRVSAPGTISTAGLDYTLGVAVANPDTSAECSSGTELRANQQISGDTSESDSTSLGASCISNSGAAAERIYPITIDAPQRVTFELQPQLSSTDLSMSLRNSCQFDGSEAACVNDVGAGEGETLTALLDPGTHFLVVQSAAGDAGGPFSLTVNSTFTACSPSTSYCGDQQTANICAPDGGRFSAVACNAGCNPSTGRCFPPDGDRCFDAQSVSPEDIGEGEQFLTETIELRQLTNNYDVAAGGCLGGEPRTGGPEQAFQIQLPAMTSVRAVVNFENEVQGSLYVVDDCTDTDGTCNVGAIDSTENDSEEVIQYSNTTDQPETKFLIVDTDADQPFSEATIQIEFIGVVCQPAMAQCSMAGNVETCNDYGTGYDETDVCGTFGCANGLCERPDTCANPLNPRQAALQPGGVTYTDVWSNYADDVGGSADTMTCDITSTHRSAPDMIWEVPLMAGEALRASVTSSGPVDNDPSMAIQSMCGDLTDMNCIVGEETENVPSEVTYVAPQQETVYVIGDADNDDNTETWTANFEIFASACSDESIGCNSSGNIEICAGAGEVPATFQCTGGCSMGFCGTRTSDFCYDAENISSDLRATGGLSRAVNFGNFNNDLEFDGCGVSTFESDGPDAVYLVDMQAGEILSASLDNGSSTDDPALRVITGCDDPSGSCVAGGEDSATASIAYQSSTAQTVYLVADVDDATTDTFQLTGSLQTQSCTPLTASCAGSGDVNFCEPPGLAERTLSCSSCCTTLGYGTASPGAAIPDDTLNGVSETLTVSGCSTTASEVSLYVNIPHTYRGDIILDLTSPDGTTAAVKSSTFDSSADLVGLYPEDFSPIDSFSTFQGEDPNGTWTLDVGDGFGGDTGTLQDWAILAACN